MMNIPARAFTRLAVAHYFEDSITADNAAVGCTGSYDTMGAGAATKDDSVPPQAGHSFCGIASVLCPEDLKL